MNKYLKIGLYLFTFCCVSFFLLLAAIQSKAVAKQPNLYQEWLEIDATKVGQEQLEVVVKSGDTTGLLLEKLGFNATVSSHIIQAAKSIYPLKNIHLNHKFIRINTKNHIELSYQIDAKQILVIQNIKGDGWQASIHQRKVYPRVDVVEAHIQDSLFFDAAKAGLADNVILKLVDMFAWDIDFVRDLRKGDAFKVMFEEDFDDEGTQVGYTILAATFTNRGHVYSGIRFEDQQGNIEYYNEEGRNLRKTYLKSPVKYSRISSRFRSARKHPVLGYTRAHRGVDYAAKTGTPIHAIGDGKIVYKGRRGGYGRFIEIRHNNGIHSTAYAHMSRYAKGMGKGKYVQQGQTIGYVGMSGLATGPHLHFEFRSRGRAVNPLKVKHKAAKPVPKDEMTAFRLKAKEMMRRMTVFDHQDTWG